MTLVDLLAYVVDWPDMAKISDAEFWRIFVEFRATQREINELTRKARDEMKTAGYYLWLEVTDD